ncbi:reverse transcriptase (RNA-dependent DNA polymerase) [Hirsutella rhossiliensis]|uniref:Reverse transcriptase (RNA-dependent DNA polymerase) domain-containing protein n=1 Tax=Hirsutella rhossiliensis TaxID=111463 RepID=A0A9P8N6U6_9HYPO|nr:reverse transcriptase (RNA-dependent DNA polymerase) domain-containing protein [Hirsutella rhossiliensis]KAH0968698.1 reverse transcriptase (RNA-dependent DNA polymerase) domain-containing protein [Hirsutella rhossiliensis]
MISNHFSLEEVEQIIKQTAPWKAAGEDGLPLGLLKACDVVVIPKPNKTQAQLSLAGSWRPISLLSTVGKIMEAAIARRLADTAETHLLLPEGQMGNRPRRSTELAVHIVAEMARTAWDRRGVASLLQLDLKGAFDRVDHTCLLQALKGRGIPKWLLDWIRSFVSNRKARLLFDGDASAPLSIHAGVPQGSPLSPILFLFYIAPLYDALEATAGTILVGFADDSNILAFGWARAVGAEFEPAKSELVHFTRARVPPQTCVRLGNTTIAPSESSRFLGVWLHRKLQWGPHLKQIRTKFQRQRVALTALAASAWGCRLPRAREIYTPRR